MAICAVIDKETNVVINRIVAEITDIPPDNCFLIDITDIYVDIGWIWNGNIFVNPNPNSEEIV